MEIRKERNILNAYDGQVFLGGLNITDGTWIGKTGKPVKAVPKCFVYNNLKDYIPYNSDQRDAQWMLNYSIYFFRHDIQGGGCLYTPARAQRFEALISLGLVPNSYSDLDDDTRLSPDIVEFCKNRWENRYSSHQVKRYLEKKKFETLRNDPDMPSWTESYLEYIANRDSSIPIDYVKHCAMRLEQEKAPMFNKVFRLVSSNNTGAAMGWIACVYYDTAMALFGSVKVEKNFLTHLSELLALKKQYDDAHYDEELTKQNNLPALYYENEEFFIRPLLTCNEFHDEAEQQHNCVERLYMKSVHDGRTHVVQVRRKNDPKKAFITCEVYTDGRVLQWLTFANNRPGEQYESLLRDYIAHLEENWEQ